MKRGLFSLLVVISTIAGAFNSGGCTTDSDEELVSAIPVTGTSLDRTYPMNGGLVTGLDEHGWPFRDGPNMDSAITEARRFYDTLRAPYVEAQIVDYPDPFTGEPPGPRLTAPITFDAWKATFQIPARMPDETLASYRQRAGVVVYYNKNELGLGRELGCSEFDDGMDPDGNTLIGIACYVTNYGTAFRDPANSLQMAGEGTHPKNTVCITYRPSLPADYQIQFYTYDFAGDRREWAQLDTLGPRPVPQVCMNCHGGSYDGEMHLAKQARFLPLDPNVVLFTESSLDGLTRADQEERIREINELSSRTPLTPAQNAMLEELYGGMLTVPGTVSRTRWTPAAWDDGDSHRDLFSEVVQPNCMTCHAAMQNDPNGNELPIYGMFESPETLLNPGLSAYLCGSFAMPNSQATLLNFWEPAAEPIVIDGTAYDTAADALLAELGTDRSGCVELETVSNCNRGENPDDLCGNAFSGKACNRITGRCVPELTLQPAPQPAGPASSVVTGAPNGVCKTDGSRRCPYPETCEPANEVVPGIEGFDGVCVP